jgi:SAM-dependent methyltransferase
MSGFAAEWLALREPYDARARNPDVLGAVAAAFAGRSSITVVDLACGTGATLRGLAPRLSARQHWRLVDNDLGLLARVAAEPNVKAIALDLVRDLEAALDGSVDLVTTSALLDLVSDEWLGRLAVEIAARRLPFYAALTYDGRIAFEPSDPLDASIVAAVNEHQHRDKGFGPALGPTGAASAVSRFEAVGYSVMHSTSDWVFGADDKDIQLELLAGWAGATQEMRNETPGNVAGWLSRRRDIVAARRSSLRVGHVDIFARPMATR